ncbi:MAG: lysyl-tRNA synthetase, class [Solirubrobacteraceae bacterium]|jgi:lysyl-tRNA synthetase class 2|nr:lysyl-tRNA synthetase, class [Solirubrobacteraceae bacterium]
MPAGRLATPAVAAAALAATVTAAAIIAALVTGEGGGPLGTAPGPPTGLAHLLAAAASVGFIVGAHALWRGSRRAAAIIAPALVGLGVAGLVEGRVLPSALALAGAVALVAGRRSFRLGGGGSDARRLAVVVVAALAGAWGLAVVAVLTADRAATLLSAVGMAGRWLWDGSWWLRSGAPPAVGLDVLVVAALVAATALIVRLVRPSASADGHSPAAHARAAAIVAEHATDSLAPFALREDKAFHFAHGGVLAYRTLRGTAVVSGDPIGPAAAAPAILASFEREAARHGWAVVLTGASARHLDGYRRLGLQAVCIGEEAVVDPATFSLAGRSMKALRHAVTRQGRRGWTVELLSGARLSPAAVDELLAVERAWRAAQPRLTGFAMTLGRLWGAEEDDHSLYVLGRDPDGRVRAFVRFAEYAGGLSLDAMRRVGDTPNGLMDALVVRAIEHARELGLRAVSLNFAGFAHIMAADRSLTLTQRVARALLRVGRGRFQLERLVMFNKKFAPRWEPRYLVHRGLPRLPVVGLRVLQAEAYVRAPRARLLTARWEPRARPVVAAPGALRQASSGPPPPMFPRARAGR